MMNRSVRSSTTRALSILVALLLPGLLAFNLVRAAGAPGSHLDSGLLPGPVLVAQAETGAARSAGSGPGSPPGMVTGVLYTRGKADVAWNGARFSVEGGSYAYVGGETVRMAPGSMGLLKLPGGGSVFLCAGSQARLTQVPGGGYNLEVMSGSSRLQMPAGTDFSIRVNDTVVRPAGASRAASPGGSMVEAEVQARSDGGCLICELKSGVSVTAGGESQGAGAQPGRIMEVAGPGVAGEARISAQPIPPELIQAAASSGDGGPAYLCHCEDLKKDLDSGPEEDTRVAESETGTDSETAASDTQSAPDVSTSEVAETPAEPTTAPAPDTGSTPVVADGPPPVAPPDAPPVAVADATAPDPFDPNVLPPPAAGEPADPVVVVAPPGVPSFGSGGGGGTGTGGGGGGGGGPVASPS